MTMLLCHVGNAEICGLLLGGVGMNEAVGRTVKFQVTGTGFPPIVALKVAVNRYCPGTAFAETRSRTLLPQLAALSL